ncbi:TrbI/VirB10 family protein [Caulobacter endophyticus]|uniref:TrbI/VirB10 family protein n=1 Tax=Caulobacter endophyticus TaxID=2172652 RepID=UPI0024105D4F|nr:TrbI/VirB10 family protein [Caulobacter endophyticus]MDG2529926.1 TrbI/VirB10 family protein [Caulobacter endophyticus]
MSQDIDPRLSPQVQDDLAAADAQARPVVAKGGGVSNLAIMTGFGVFGVAVFAWLSSHRADASQRPQAAPPAAAQPAPVAKLAQMQGPLYAVPAPQFTVDNSAPAEPAPPPAPAYAPPPPAAVFAGPADDSGRRRAPTLVVDLSDRGQPAAKPAPGSPAAVAGEATRVAALNPDERFADRVGLDEAAPAKASAMQDLDAVIPQGAVIPAVMETAINSDLPGLARAMVTRDVKSFDGSTVLIPRGSRVIGQYKSGLALGASRVFVIWTRVIRPDGVSVQIGSPAADPLGRGGLEGKVDRHFFTRFGGSILTSVLSAGVAAVSNSRANSQIYIGSMSEAANLANAAKGTNTSPTIKTPQGAPVTIFVARDLDFSGVRGLK